MRELAADRLAEISAAVIEQADQYRAEFLDNRPFRHVVIESFLDADFAQKLWNSFRGSTLRWLGKRGARPALRRCLPIFAKSVRRINALRRYIRKAVSGAADRLVGNTDLILDPKMLGGGTHANLHRQELDPHLDFNYDEARQLHRRLNLIVYLNPDWREERGGALEVRSKPRRPEENQIRAYDPLLNRWVMFE
jgi:hypothetical protein